MVDPVLPAAYLPYVAAFVPVHPELLPVHCGSHREVWFSEGWVYGSLEAATLPPVL